MSHPAGSTSPTASNHMLNHQRRVVVTGVGALTPLGHSAPALWEAMLNGESGADLISKFDPAEFETKFACEVRDFDALDHFDRKDARKLDRFTQYGAVAGREAVHDSGILNAAGIDLDAIGVTFGSGIGGIELFQDLLLTLFQGFDFLAKGSIGLLGLGGSRR